MTDVFKKYEKKFTDLFTELYDEAGGCLSGISCEKVGPNVVSEKSCELFVSFKVW